jgi:hypothetical protein
LDDPLPTMPDNESRVDDEEDHRNNSVVDAQLTLPTTSTEPTAKRDTETTPSSMRS